MATETTVATGGIGLGGLAFVVLLALKLAGAIELGWLWVITSFVWVPLLAALGVIACIAVVFAFVWVLGKL